MKEKEVREKMNPKKKKKIIKRSIFAAVALVVVVLIVKAVSGAGNAVKPVTTTQVLRGDIAASLNTSGNVSSEVSKVYFAPVSAPVSQLNVQLGDMVTAGEQLIAFDTEGLEREKKQTDLTVEASNYSYQGALAGDHDNLVDYTDATNNIANVKPMIEFQEQYIEDLQKSLQNKQSENRVGLYTQQQRLSSQLESLQAQYATAVSGSAEATELNRQIAETSNALSSINLQISLLGDVKELTELEQKIVQEQKVLADLETFLAEQEAIKKTADASKLTSYQKGELRVNNESVAMNQELSQDNLDKALKGIIADFDGIVTDVNTVEGMTVMAGGQLLTLQSSKEVKVDFTVSKYDLEKLEIGQKVDITISGNTYTGCISKIDHIAVPNASGTPMVGAQVHIDNPDDGIYLGIEAKIVVHTASAQNVLLLPVEAVNADKEGDFCYIVENGVVAKRRLVTGISSDQYIEIIEGLLEGEEVITGVSAGIEEGMAVMAIPQS